MSATGIATVVFYVRSARVFFPVAPLAGGPNRLDFTEADEGLARAYGNLECWPEARTSFRQVLQLKPDFYQACAGLGFAYGMVNGNNVALQAFKEAIRLKPNFCGGSLGPGQYRSGTRRPEAALQEHKILQNLEPEMDTFLCGTVLSTLPLFLRPIGIGRSLTASPLQHLRAFGSRTTAFRLITS